MSCSRPPFTLHVHDKSAYIRDLCTPQVLKFLMWTSKTGIHVVNLPLLYMYVIIMHIYETCIYIHHKD